ncbi:MAG TPA: DNA mismatch repair endonuclease MutL [Candidatus Binataceae bacterium]|nr:DNA mismatch repair endonuclease MutL [Candidatus Binataceae bacterium]
MSERVVHILPEQVASQIAAGEVVERPASAVKEMVENSLDAGAHAIQVEIERGGGALIAVADDGAGMGREDAVLSLRRHATSKIRDAADLWAVRTFGFRGEALASIASVSRLKLQSRRAADAHGVELSAEAGELIETRACAMAPGTRIEVCDLFFNTPARLKFMKSVATEQGTAAEAVQRLALANPAVAFRLIADGRTIFDLPRAASALERIRQTHGARIAGAMLPFEFGGAGMRAWGLCLQSQESFPTARLTLTFVNRRVIRDRVLMRAIAQAYQTLIPRGRYPAVVLFVELRPEEVDVNVHPMKTEVRFRRAGAVFDLVYHALRTRLKDQAAPSAAAAGEAESASIANAAGSIASASAAASMVEELAPPRREIASPMRPLRLVADAGLSATATQRPLGLGFRIGGGAAAETNAGTGVPAYSRLKILGQIFAGFVALEGEDGLLLIDQHAAHERVTFEKLREELRVGGVRVQPLLTPAVIELNPARAAQVIAAIPEIGALGFEVESFGPSALLLKGAPAVFGPEAGRSLLEEMIDSVGENGFRTRSESAFEDLLKTLACHGSVRAGRTLEVREIAELLVELDRTEFKTNCPHGRPVHIEFRRGQIERMFRR